MNEELFELILSERFAGAPAGPFADLRVELESTDVVGGIEPETGISSPTRVGSGRPTAGLLVATTASSSVLADAVETEITGDLIGQNDFVVAAGVIRTAATRRTHAFAGTD